jgi:acylpyruvate hydrolase
MGTGPACVVQRLNGGLFQDGRRLPVRHSPPRRTCLERLHARGGRPVLTGTPSGIGLTGDPPIAMAHGEVVEIEIDGIGVLRNPVVDEGR